MEKEQPPRRTMRGAANDNGGMAAEPLDPRIIRVAEAIGRQLAREHVKAACQKPANDNKRRQ